MKSPPAFVILLALFLSFAIAGAILIEPFGRVVFTAAKRLV